MKISQVPPNTTVHEIAIEILPVNDKPSFELLVSNVSANEGNGSISDTHTIFNMIKRITPGFCSFPSDSWPLYASTISVYVDVRNGQWEERKRRE